MRLLLLKSTKFAHQAGYYLQGGRWHSIKQDKPAPKGAPVSAHPHAAGKPVQKETLAEHEWGQLKLPDTNTNAGTFNKQLDQLKVAAANGDVTGILGSGYGTNTYGKKLVIIANHVLGLLGSEHKVTPGQKAGAHAAVQTAPDIEAGEKPELGDTAKELGDLMAADKAHQEKKAAKKPSDQPAKSVSAETVPAPSDKGEASSSFSMPEFTEGKQAKGVKAHYEKTAKKIIDAAEAGDLSALQSMPTDKGNSWKGKTENSKKLMALHQAAIAMVQGGTQDAEQPKPAPEANKDAALNAANDHLKEDAQQSDLPAAEQKEDQALVSKLEAAVEQPKQSEQKPVASQKPEDVSDKAGSVSPASDKLAQIPWDKMLLPDSNKNAKSHNGKVAHIKAMAEAGDIEGLKNFKAGVNTYGKKQNLLAQTALAALEENAAAGQQPQLIDNLAAAETGKPLSVKVYHGTEADFSDFSLDHSPEGALFFTDKLPIAQSFGSKVKAVMVEFSNPLVVHGSTLPEEHEIEDMETLVGKAKSGGHDGVVIKDFNDYGKVSNTALVFDEKHIKSSENHVATDDPVAAENDGPQEGETKQGADGTLVFHNGRWHKQGEDSHAAEKPAPASPAEVELPTFNGPNATHNKILTNAATALKEKIAAEGKAGFKGVLTNHKTGHITVTIGGAKIAKASVNSKTPGLAEFAKFVDELKAAAGKAKAVSPKQKAAATPSPAEAPEPAKELESMDHWTQTGGQGGSNPGGKFKDQDGVEWYCKFPADQDTAKAEVLAAKLYTALGLNAQDAKLVTKDGKVGIASRWQDVKKVTAKELANTPGVLAGFAADAWLANWDVVGLGFDNLQVDEKGNAMRVDAGGSLMYRAQGGKKAFGDTVTELDSLRDKKLNPQAAAVFGGMSQADITASVAKVAQISDAQIRILVNTNGPGTKVERKALADTLIARKNDLLAKYPKAAKQTKKRLDPNNLPVKDDQLPKRHDFSNWNGPSQPLSSKAHVNEANQKVEDEVLAIAKTGNLTKLKEYKFQPVDKDSGQPVGEPKPISEHPSKHVVQYHADLVQLLDEIANPPQPLKIFQESDVNTLDELEMAFPPKKFGTTVGAVHSNEKLGFWVVLGGVHGAEKFKPKKMVNFTQQAIASAYDKFKEASKLAKHFVYSVQASGSYNDLFRDGKETDHSGNKLADVAQAALEFATEQPEGTGLYRWQNMSDEMVKKIMSAPEGSVFQATGPMCTSYSPTATSGFGKHRVTIRYAKGAKAVDSFGSGKFAGEKEITTLPNSRFVILERKMVPSEKGGGERLELEVLMLPPDLGL